MQLSKLKKLGQLGKLLLLEKLLLLDKLVHLLHRQDLQHLDLYLYDLPYYSKGVREGALGTVLRIIDAPRVRDPLHCPYYRIFI